MAHVDRLSALFASITAAVTAIADAFLAAWVNFTDAISTAFHVIDWPEFRPEARTSIALDAATREYVDTRQPGIVARFAEFVRRALTHDEFTAGHYDPGWRPA